MVFCAIPAGGTGTRMGSPGLPKQFMDLGGCPILIYTIKAIAACSRIDVFYIGIHKDWMNDTEELIKKHLEPAIKVHLVEGGNDRNGTLLHILQDIHIRYPGQSDGIIVTHDAVRPFVTTDMVTESIKVAREYGACTAAIPVADTIGIADIGQKMIQGIPPRDNLYQIQTPQTFRLPVLWDSMQKLTETDRQVLTDACKVCIMQNRPVKIIDGNPLNFKITTPSDYRMAQAIVSKNISEAI